MIVQIAHVLGRPRIQVVALNDTTKHNDHIPLRSYFCESMSRLIIFIPSGETEPVTIRIEHVPDLPVPGIWNVVTNVVYLRTELWSRFPAGDQIGQRKLFDQLLRVSRDLPSK